jgi:branched-subunit amino acid transport protein
MSEETILWIAILGVSLTSFVTRASFVAFATRLRLPPLVEQALRLAPAAVLGAIAVPALLMHGGHVDASLGNQRLIAGCAAALVMWFTRSMISSIITGMLLMTALRLWA